ncbi:MAG: hypothetical protein HYT70_01810 [Candidatus Aenigmarchaeota archaeon]|nr:hypothetical protein [Candidatus Aenigmarchaeota archaeon]
MEVLHKPVKRFSEMFPDIAMEVEESLDVASERTGYNFRPYMRDPLVTVVGNEVITAINEGYQLLTPDQQTALAYVAHETPYNVIAALMGKSEVNIKVIVHRARAAMGAYLALSGVDLPRRYLDRMIDRERRTAQIKLNL